ncbi:hypothetical protein KCP76_22310 [Salmonella enterica subsp. enterica serovar Weltevreden]|nr:hypothetical protein KCP76_22310 [Salmonella enterica subsp. enterica serovar Weltevreden]
MRPVRGNLTIAATTVKAASNLNAAGKNAEVWAAGRGSYDASKASARRPPPARNAERA